MESNSYPYGEFDASKWADEFTRIFDGTLIRRGDNEAITGDDLWGLLVSWFANAIMTGYDYARESSFDPKSLGVEIWDCKIGEVDEVPDEADGSMREAVEAAYKEVTGKEARYIFSGWGASLSNLERIIVENEYHQK